MGLTCLSMISRLTIIPGRLLILRESLCWLCSKLYYKGLTKVGNTFRHSPIEAFSARTLVESSTMPNAIYLDSSLSESSSPSSSTP